MITSPANRKIKEVTALLKKTSERRSRGLFVVEGIKMFEEIPSDRLREVYLSESFAAEHPISGAEIVADDVFAKMSATRTPQGVLAVVAMPDAEKAELLSRTASSFLILERLQDPGNLGTILRMAEAAGIEAVIMSSDTADIYNPKVVRSTMGSIFRVPFYYAEDLAGEIHRLQKLGTKVYAAHLKGTQSYDGINYPERTAFLIGNESRGLSEEIAACADAYIRIPMAGEVESLNAAIAATVLSFELARQRRLRA